MTCEPSLEHEPHGVIAALEAFWVRLFELVRGLAGWREQTRQLLGYEAHLVYALLGGGLRHDPSFAEAAPEIQRSWRKGLARDLALVRNIRIRRHLLLTFTGRGYRRNSVTISHIRFERRIATRRVRRLGRARLAFVASTRETLAGAPP